MREAGRRNGRRLGWTSAEQHENMSLLEMLPEVKTQDQVAPLPSLSNSVILFYRAPACACIRASPARSHRRDAYCGCTPRCPSIACLNLPRIRAMPPRMRLRVRSYSESVSLRARRLYQTSLTRASETIRTVGPRLAWPYLDAVGSANALSISRSGP